jgi:hypothetical protein
VVGWDEKIKISENKEDMCYYLVPGNGQSGCSPVQVDTESATSECANLTSYLLRTAM